MYWKKKLPQFHYMKEILSYFLCIKSPGKENFAKFKRSGDVTLGGADMNIHEFRVKAK